MIVTLALGCGENHLMDGCVSYAAAYAFTDGRILKDSWAYENAERAREEAGMRWPVDRIEHPVIGS